MVRRLVHKNQLKGQTLLKAKQIDHLKPPFFVLFFEGGYLHISIIKLLMPHIYISDLFLNACMLTRASVFDLVLEFQEDGTGRIYSDHSLGV